MKIIFDSKTPLRKMQSKMIIFPEIIEKAKAEIKGVIPHSIFDFFGMTISEFLRLQENIIPEKVSKYLSKRKTTFFDYIRIVNAFEQGSKTFEQMVTDTILHADADEEAAKAGLLELTTEEAMLTALKEFYPYKTLEELQKVTLYEYVTSRRIAFNNAKFQKNLINIQKIKI